MNNAVLELEVTLPKTGEQIKLFLETESESVRGIPKNKLKAAVKPILQDVDVDQPFAIADTTISYQLVERGETPDFGNTIVEAHIPYCLHLPNGTALDVWEIDELFARAVCRKVWTVKAEGSSTADVYAEDRVTYFKKCTLDSPQLPHEELLGWDLAIKGVNVEKRKDNTGYFRYTKLSIFLNTDYSEGQLSEIEEVTKIIKEIQDITIGLVNRALDAYRFVTQEDFVERLGFVNITNVYFFDHDQGFYPVSMNSEGAMMNRSRVELQQIRRMLKRGERPPLYELLLLNAQSLLNRRVFNLSIVSSFQGLEVYLENYLTERHKDQGLSESDIEKQLRRTWRTKSRLKEAITETTGHSIYDEARSLWDGWCTMYDQVRNAVLHKGSEGDQDGAERALRLNQNVVDWIKELQLPGPYGTQPPSDRTKSPRSTLTWLLQRFRLRRIDAHR